MGYRMYDPGTGRFLTRDPILDGSNHFAYVGNDPLNNVDPTGLTPVGQVAAAIVDAEKKKQARGGTSGSTVNPKTKGDHHQIDIVRPNNSRKQAEEAAKRKSAKGQKPIEHRNPKKGDPHFHAVNAKGEKIPNTHYPYRSKQLPRAARNVPWLRGAARGVRGVSKALLPLELISMFREIVKRDRATEPLYQDAFGTSYTWQEWMDEFGYDPRVWG